MHYVLVKRKKVPDCSSSKELRSGMAGLRRKLRNLGRVGVSLQLTGMAGRGREEGPRTVLWQHSKYW
jgi:hypothetical protein